VSADSPGKRWALARGASETWRRFREGWVALPTGNVARWTAAVVIGFVLVCLLTWGLTYLGRTQTRRFDQWDDRTLRGIAGGFMSFQNAILAESPGNLSYLIPLTAVATVISARARRPILAMSFLAAYVLARPIIFLGWSLWDRPRPTMIAGGIAAPPLHSYPSGHVILAVSLYGLLAYVWCSASKSWPERLLAWVLFTLWIAMIGWARLRLGTHWPSDVIVGILIGLAWLVVVIAALRRGERPAAARFE
jgi:membrane-associated phospholipid phosphatase